MKRIILYIILFLMISPVFAQRRGPSEIDREKFEAARVAFITKRLDLSPQQAEKFWPKFNQYAEDRRKLMREMNSLMGVEESSLTDNKAKELLEKRFRIEQEMLDQHQAFMKDITSVISPVQAFKLTEVNKEFTKHIYRMQRNGRESSSFPESKRNNWGIDNVRLHNNIQPIDI